MIIKNAIRCNICGDEIESKHRHDYVPCRCGTCAVDGGHDYLRRSFSSVNDYTELSITRPDSVNAAPPAETQFADHQIGNATYHVERAFAGDVSRRELILNRVISEYSKEKEEGL